MLIPIFGSCPTYLNSKQEEIKRIVLSELGKCGLEWRSVGQTDYPIKFPLREVLVLAKHCSGGIILGFSQFETKTGIFKRGTPYEKRVKTKTAFPTPWNQLEAGILFSMGKPLIIIHEKYILGGIFDKGVTDLFIHEIQYDNSSKTNRKIIKDILQKWSVDVKKEYYS